MTAAASAAVTLRGITKRFPGVVANENVDLEILPGEIHALLGENGAGKTTLSNIVTGLYRADDGEMLVHGRPVEFRSPRDAIAAGIGMVHQHFRLVEPFTVAENVVLGYREDGAPAVRFSPRAVEARVRELAERYRMPVNPRARIWQLSVGEQQRVEILKTLYRGARILILDEPTAVLTPPEADDLFLTLRRMAAEGRAVVFISHKLEEVMRVSDRVTVLRDGRNVGTVATAGTDTRALARLMVGREVVFTRKTTKATPSSRVVLELKGVSALGDTGTLALRDVSFTVHAGEIVGVAGVSGNGQRPLAEVITGTRARAAGAVTVDDTPLGGRDPREAIDRGVSHIPEDRMHVGLAGGMSISDNLALKGYRKAPFSSGPLLRRKRLVHHAVELIDRFDVRAPGPDTPSRLLSGGNVQKVLLAREFSGDPHVLVAACPTRGLDVGATETVRSHLLDAAGHGVGILLISEDLDEILALADRILVLYEGAIVGELDGDHPDVEQIGFLMAGASTKSQMKAPRGAAEVSGDEAADPDASEAET